MRIALRKTTGGAPAALAARAAKRLAEVQAAQISDEIARRVTMRAALMRSRQDVAHYVDLGDPPPGRSALDQRNAALATTGHEDMKS